MMAKNILMGSYGKGRPNKETGEIDPLPVSTYCFNGKKTETRYFFLGLCKLLEVKIDEVFLFLTKESKDAFEGRIRKEAEEAGVGVQIFEIPSAGTIEEVWRGFDVITETFENLASEGNNIYLDITNGFRHLPLISFVSLLYLESANRLSVKGAYYGAFDAKLPEVQETQVFDLSSLLKIVRGSFAVEQFEKTGNLTPLRNFIEDVLKEHTEEKFKITDFEELSSCVSSGLPIEAGLLAYKKREFLENKLPEARNEVKALERLLDKITKKLDEFSIFGSKDKQSVELNLQELERELRFIKWHLDMGNISTALLLLREWIVNRCILSEGNPVDWLKERDNIENLLHTQEKSKKQGVFKDWDELAQRRNEYAHAGMRNKNVKIKTGKEKAEEAYEHCLTNISNDEYWRLSREPNKVLITPMGASVGLLYSALSLIKPDRVVVLTSDKFQSRVAEVAEKAGFSDMSKIHVEIIKDVFCGFDEANALAKKLCSHIDNAGKIEVNLTGGTTAMQWAIQAAYEAIQQKLGNPGKEKLARVAFVDRRRSAEQQSDPYVVGEMVKID
ncbi:MAG: TM1812 family CRISPR-associated protein [Candidatus Riflebacteria bacterium]|nr:TM1812 family CRISPR-associated protein [Candidatus Riflebacteria bacterium]